MYLILSRPNVLKIIVSSKRFKNSGLKCFFNSSFKFFSIADLVVSKLLKNSLPIFEVSIITVFLKLT